MNTKHAALLERLENFQLDSPEAALPFSARLARENNWTPTHAMRVIEEYKRFAFLAVAAGHPVSPSEDVDQAWHLHLTYSENYWKVFCPQILGSPLHHNPTKGGKTEQAKFQDWYARTLESYETFFGTPAPADIWPSPETHQKEKHSFVRVDCERNWVIPKPRLQLKPKVAFWLGLGALMFLSTGDMLAKGVNVFNWRGPDFLEFYVFLLATCFGIASWLRRRLRVPKAALPLRMPELDGYATAFLNGGKVLAVNTAIANLIRQGAMRVSKEGRLLTVTSLVPQPHFEHVLERVVYASAASSSGNELKNVRQNAKPAVTAIADDLKSRGLIVADELAIKAIIGPLVLALAATVVGVIKILIGLNRDRPVAFLTALCIVSFVISMVAFVRRPGRSQYGDAVLKRLKESHIGPRRLNRGLARMPGTEFAAVVGLLGMTALAGTELSDLNNTLQPPSGGSSCGSGCGGGCGGGGCGGGCGGCGGGD